MKKVLLVDDSQVARMNIKQPFEEASYEVVEASSGAQALETIQNTPDLTLVVIDYTMPVMNGITFARKLREFNKTLPIAFLSAQVSEKLRKEAKDVNAICWALKSISGKELVKLVDKYLDGKAGT